VHPASEKDANAAKNTAGTPATRTVESDVIAGHTPAGAAVTKKDQGGRAAPRHIAFDGFSSVNTSVAKN
jgi:hypothetical protein